MKRRVVCPFQNVIYGIAEVHLKLEFCYYSSYLVCLEKILVSVNYNQ